MALATRCPQCQAMFRVVADQLKLRGGLVRCGSCRHVFDAIGSLNYVDDRTARTAPLAGQPAQRTSTTTAAFVTPRDALPPAVPTATQSSAAAAAPARRDSEAAALGVPTLLITESAPTDVQADDADQAGPRGARPTGLSDVGAAARSGGAHPDRNAWLGRQGRSAGHAGKQAAFPHADDRHDGRQAGEEPAFLRREPRRRGLSFVFGTGNALLVTAALVQLAVLFRVDLATAVPQARPALVQLCEPLNCTVGWPTRADLLAVVGTELQAVPGTDILELTAVVRSRATHPLALPAIEVTLTDTQNRALARRVFTPAEYLASSAEPRSRIDEGLAAGADYIVRLSFEARQISAAGFVVYPFYL
jgi:predicted Zn finger-like uncharacterized protein